MASDNGCLDGGRGVQEESALETRRMQAFPHWAWVCFLATGTAFLCAGETEGYKSSREELFEFAQKPSVTRHGDRVTVAFETKGFCDVSVAIENTQGRIIRHLACGLLGPKAPAPLQVNSKKQ